MGRVRDTFRVRFGNDCFTLGLISTHRVSGHTYLVYVEAGLPQT